MNEWLSETWGYFFISIFGCIMCFIFGYALGAQKAFNIFKKSLETFEKSLKGTDDNTQN